MEPVFFWYMVHKVRFDLIVDQLIWIWRCPYFKFVDIEKKKVFVDPASISVVGFAHCTLLGVFTNVNIFLGSVQWICFGALAMTKQWHCSCHVSRTLQNLQILKIKRITFHQINALNCPISKFSYLYEWEPQI